VAPIPLPLSPMYFIVFLSGFSGFLSCRLLSCSYHVVCVTLAQRLLQFVEFVCLSVASRITILDSHLKSERRTFLVYLFFHLKGVVPSVGSPFSVRMWTLLSSALAAISQATSLAGRMELPSQMRLNGPLF